MRVQDPELKLHPGVFKRPNSTFWQFFVTVPVELAHHFDGKTFAYRKSLKTRDLAEANLRAKRIDAEWAEHFSRLLAQDNPQPTPITPALVATVAAELRRWVLKADDNMRGFPEGPQALLRYQGKGDPEADPAVVGGSLLIPQRQEREPLAGLTDSEAGAVAEFNAKGLAASTTDVARRNLREAHEWAVAVSRGLGVHAEWMSPEGVAALVEVQKALALARADAVRRDAGEVIDTPQNAPLNAQEPIASAVLAEVGQRRMDDALAAWEGLGVRKAKTLSVFRRHVRQFKEMTGDPLLAHIAKPQATKFRADLQRWAVETGKTRETADNVLASIKALANVAVGEGWMASSPFASLAVKEGGRETESREPWAPDDLPKLFASPIFSAYTVPPADTALSRKAGLDAAYWVPLLCLFTGARPGEVCQLWTDDLSEVRDSTGKALLVTEFRANDARGQSLKNPASWRALPIHTKLMELGFGDYLHAIRLRHGQAGPLFPAMQVSGSNGPGAQFGQWFGKFKEAQGFGATKTLHSFRHTVETELAFAEVSPTLVDAITGHEGQGTGRKQYATTIRRNAVRLRPSLERLQFPGLRLMRVFRAPVWSPT